MLYELKNFGIHGSEEINSVGANGKMNEFCAAMGICNLRHVDEEIEKRKKVYERYSHNLSGASGIRLNTLKPEVKSNYAYFPIVIDENAFGCNRNTVYERLAENGIYTRKYFYPLTNSLNCYEDIYDINDTPIAKKVSERVLTLPMYADLSMGDIDRICEIILTKD